MAKPVPKPAPKQEEKKEQPKKPEPPKSEAEEQAQIMQAIQASMADMPLYERELFELYRNQENPGAAQNNANAQAPALIREESKEIKGYNLA